MDLRVTTSRIGEAVVVSLDGSADLATAPRLDSQLRAAIARHQGDTLFVDLDGLVALDDVALGILLGATGTARSDGGDIIVVCSDDSRRARLTATGFQRAITVRRSISEQGTLDEHGAVAVIFTSQRTDADADGYAAAAARMEELSSSQPGFLGIETVRGDDGVGITVSYWESAAAAAAWKQQSEHLIVQQAGREHWYDWYRVRIATIDRAYTFDATHDAATHDAGSTAAPPITLHHLALPADWADAESSADYTVSTRGITLEQEGFIHCSFPEQIEGVANRFYGDLTELVILHVDTGLIDAEVVVEPAVHGGTELFPHVYGPIPTRAVRSTTTWFKGDDGAWHRPNTI